MKFLKSVPQAIFENLCVMYFELDNEQANCSIIFKINGGFTRSPLLGNRTKSKSDMQIKSFKLCITIISKQILLIPNKVIYITQI